MENNRISNILVPLDFSEASLNSLETAIAIAKKQKAKITLLNVVDSSLMFGFNGVYYVSEKTIDSIVDVSARMLSSLVTRISKEHGLECASEIRVGLVPQSIIKTAQVKNSDLIIMGTHGTSGFREFFLGSMAQKVLQISFCPVLTIPLGRKWLDFKKILFPIRPINGAIEKYNFLLKTISSTLVSIDILVLARTYDEIEKKLLQSLVKELKKKVIKDEIKISGKLKVGAKMPQAVLRMSKSIDADLIVITAATDSDFKQFFIGPFEQHIVNHATMPVLSVRPKLTSPDSRVIMQQIHESFPSQIPSIAG
jgi:nucleotide-binding universal stress UspA family protein